MDRLAELIRIAGQSRTGFVSLIMVFLSGFMIVALDRAPPFIRFSGYCGLVAGVGMFSWIVYQAALLPPGVTSLR